MLEFNCKFKIFLKGDMYMNIEKIKDVLSHQNFITSIIALVVIFAIYQIIKKLINLIVNKIDSKNTRNYKKKKTYLKLVNSCFKYIFVVLAILIVLQINGIDITSIITGLGIVSIIVGLALQDALKDIIMGFNIIVDNYFSVGDVIKIDDVEGKVIGLGIKNTKIEDINNPNVLVIANRNISKSKVLANRFDIDIPLPYEENIQKMEEVLNEIINKVKENVDVNDIKYEGISEFADSAIKYKLRIWCKIENKFQVQRAILRIIKIELDEKNIQIPYNQLDVHTK